jgi:hypothetical protein
MGDQVDKGVDAWNASKNLSPGVDKSFKWVLQTYTTVYQVWDIIHNMYTQPPAHCQSCSSMDIWVNNRLPASGAAPCAALPPANVWCPSLVNILSRFFRAHLAGHNQDHYPLPGWESSTPHPHPFALWDATSPSLPHPGYSGGFFFGPMGGLLQY